MSCSQCGKSNAEDAAYCSTCSTPLAAEGQGRNPSSGTSAPAFQFDARRWTRSELAAGAAALVLFASLFMPWFGVTSDFTGVTVSVNGLWHGYMYVTLFAALAILAYLVACAGFQTLPFRLPSGGGEFFLTAVASLNLLLVLISVLNKPGLTTWQGGAYAGLIAAIAAVAAPRFGHSRSRQARSAEREPGLTSTSLAHRQRRGTTGPSGAAAAARPRSAGAATQPASVSRANGSGAGHRPAGRLVPGGRSGSCRR